MAESEAVALLINHHKEGKCVTNAAKKKTTASYPFKPLLFIMASAALQSSFSGVQAILEIYFSRFVFLCSSVSHSKVLATVAVNVFIAVNQLSALSGGFLADCLLGNFHTQNLSNIMATGGIILVLFSSWQYSLNEPHCCHHSVISNSTTPLFNACHLEFSEHRILSYPSFNMSSELLIALIAIGCLLFSIGNGHLNAAQSVFVGDQFPEGQSSAKQKSFSWYFLFQNIGNLLCDSGMPFVRQSFGYILTFLVITGAYGLSTIIFILGITWYSHSKSEQRLCCCKRMEESKSSLSIGNNKREIFSIFGVCLPMIGFWALFFQQNSTWVLQGAMMNCYIGRLHLPPDMMPSINDLMVIVLIPTLDYLVYPHLKRTMNITIRPLQKIVVGMICVSLSFLLASLLQMYLTPIPISCRGDVSILWQLPQLLLMSLAEVLVGVTGLEFTYTQPPARIRNICNGVWCITLALGAALNAAIALIQLSLLHEFILYTGLMCVVICVFVGVNWNFQYKT